MSHAQAEIAVAVVVDVVAVKVEQILLKHRLRIQHHHQRKILKSQQRIVAVAVVVHQVKALFQEKLLKKMASLQLLKFVKFAKKLHE